MKTSPEIDPSDLEPEIDIDLATQTRILELAARLHKDDHYSLLGVSQTAEKGEIKRAYFALMNTYHADRFFGKNLGKFASILLSITAVLTRASDTLSRNKTRSEYDSYLDSRRGTLGARLSVLPLAADSDRPASPSEPIVGLTGRPAVAPIDIYPNFPPVPPAPLVDLHELVELQELVDLHELVEVSNSLSEPTPSSEGSQPSSNPEPLVTPRSPSSSAAKRLLARKMGLRARATPTPSPSEGAKEALRADLKARYDARKFEKEEKLTRLLADSERSRSTGDWSNAVASMRMAMELSPDDPAIQLQLTAVQAEADRALAPRFMEQAKYEEKQGDFARAARSYERAARGKDSAQLFNMGAECLLHLKTMTAADKRMAVELARNAVTRDHLKAQFRITLAQAYDASGMKTSALGEVKRALELEPENQQAKLLQKSLK